MIVDVPRSLKMLLLPALLLVSVYLLQLPLAEDLEELDETGRRLPYVLLFIGMLFALLFRHSREFFNQLILVLSCLTLDGLLWSSPTHPQAIVIYTVLCLLAPINLLLNDLWRERGIVNRHGLQRLLVIAVQLALVYWLLNSTPDWLSRLLAYAPITTGMATPIVPLAQLVMLICGVTLLVYTFTHPTTLQSALGVTFLALVFALHYVPEPAVARLYLSLAGLLMIVALLLNLRRLAYYDELTQLPSRRALRQALMALGHRYSLAMVDVDHFKKLNDAYGHDVGDQVLKMLASRLSKVKGGKAFRYGGEEFTLVFSGKPADETLPALEQLRETIATTPFKVRHKSRPAKRPETPHPKAATPELSISVSIGVADTTAADDSQTIMKRADQALYQAKKKGRNRVVAS